MEKFPINSSCNRNAPSCLQFFVKLPNELIRIWAQMKEKMQNGEISPEEYVRWRDYYPKYDTTVHWHHITPDIFTNFPANQSE